METLNLALLNKSKWQILKEDNATGSNILKYKYVNPTLKVLIDDETVLSNRDSIWWRDLVLYDTFISVGEQVCRSY